jgi:hypothetical protein
VVVRSLSYNNNYTTIRKFNIIAGINNCLFEKYMLEDSIRTLRKMKRHNIDKQIVKQELRKHLLQTSLELLVLYPLIRMLNVLEKIKIR